MAARVTSGGKKNRKHKRSARKPAHLRYLAENRTAVNKARRVARHTRKSGG